MWKQKANAQRARHSFKSNTHTHTRSIMCIRICCVHTNQPQSVAYVVVTFEFVVCCASFAVFALFCAQTMRTSRGKKY